MSYKSIPISAAREISKKFDKDQVIIVAWDKTHGRQHVTTYGKTTEECRQAAEGGNLVKRALGWPEELCKAKPRRARAARTPRECAEEIYRHFPEMRAADGSPAARVLEEIIAGIQGQEPR